MLLIRLPLNPFASGLYAPNKCTGKGEPLIPCYSDQKKAASINEIAFFYLWTGYIKNFAAIVLFLMCKY